jgi:hypothetical protein
VLPRSVYLNGELSALVAHINNFTDANDSVIGVGPIGVVSISIGVVLRAHGKRKKAENRDKSDDEYGVIGSHPERMR